MSDAGSYRRRALGRQALYLYLLAQVQARVGGHAGAFATLDEMFGVPGFYNERWVQHDPGFASLRRQPSFQTAVTRWSQQRGAVLLGAATASAPAR